MPVKYRIDRSLRLVVITFQGKITEEEIINDKKKLVQDPDFDPSFSQLIDLSGVGLIQSPTTTISNLAQSSVFKKRVKRAIIAPGDVVFGLSRMYELLSIELNQQTAIFLEVKKALEWLMISEEKFFD